MHLLWLGAKFVFLTLSMLLYSSQNGMCISVVNALYSSPPGSRHPFLQRFQLDAAQVLSSSFSFSPYFSPFVCLCFEDLCFLEMITLEEWASWVLFSTRTGSFASLWWLFLGFCLILVSLNISYSFRKIYIYVLPIRNLGSASFF